MRRRFKFTPFILCVLLLGAGLQQLCAQAGRGSGRLKGAVVFADTGQPAPNVTVTLEFADEAGAKFQTKTGNDGQWLFAHLGRGNFRLKAGYPGYTSKEETVMVFQVERPNPFVTLKLVKGTEKILAENADLIEKGNQLVKEEKYGQALAAYEAFLARTPEFYEAYINIGNCLLKMGKPGEAAARFRGFLDRAADAPPEMKAACLKVLGQIHLQKNDMPAAQEYFIQSISLSPKDEILAYNVAEIFFAAGKYPEALRYFEIAARIKPKWSPPYLKMGYVYSNLGDITKAIQCFENFVKLEPEHAEVPIIRELVKSLKEV